jgi:signal transduction histidine kinase
VQTGLRKLLRTSGRLVRDNDAWPVVLVLLAVLIPAVGLLWFMAAVMQNERLAARQKLADIYRTELSVLKPRVEQDWNSVVAGLEQLAHTGPASAVFARCVQSGLVDGVIVFDDAGRIAYPNAPSTFQSESDELDPKWAEAGLLEYLRRDFMTAASRYEAFAKSATNPSIAARAWQAKARCLVQAGHHDAAIRCVEETLSSPQYRHAADPQGRLIVANAELMALELLTNRASPVFHSTSQRLKERLMDYENPVLAASQRRFLMQALQALCADIAFPTLAAEELTARACENPVALTAHSTLGPGPLPGTWQFAMSDHRAVVLIQSDKLRARLQKVVAAGELPEGAEVALLPPGMDHETAFVLLAAGPALPGWRLALSLKDQSLFEATTTHRTNLYLWTGILVMAAMGVLTLLAVRLLRRQVNLARLKNDLAATVSHELKTPLASMRVLVDTLLESDSFDPQKTREYLQLIGQENERLGRLIQNFLTFSRMERRKHTFHFTPSPVLPIVEAAVESVRGRFDAPGCQLEVRSEGHLPQVMADPGALVTALVNLLENSYKYSEEIKHVLLRIGAKNGNVIISVKDNGIGIAPRERKRIFQAFYQVDQRLSRTGSGCGLGLSIVQFIAAAHHGSVSVESQPGCGSTFIISLPAVPEVPAFPAKAIA